MLCLKDGCIVGFAKNTRGKLLTFNPLINARALRMFAKGGVGSNFYMGPHVSCTTIGALPASDVAQCIVQLDEDHAIHALPSDEEESARYEVSFHPIFKLPNESATMHLVKDPVKCQLGEAFVVNDIILASPRYYAGCFALGVNVKKGVDDGVAAHDAVWALCNGAVAIKKTQEKEGQQYMADGLLKK